MFLSCVQVESAAEQATKSVVQQCEQFAAKLLEDEVALYKTSKSPQVPALRFCIP